VAGAFGSGEDLLDRSDVLADADAG